MPRFIATAIEFESVALRFNKFTNKNAFFSRSDLSRSLLVLIMKMWRKQIRALSECDKKEHIKCTMKGNIGSRKTRRNEKYKSGSGSIVSHDPSVKQCQMKTMNPFTSRRMEENESDAHGLGFCGNRVERSLAAPEQMRRRRR